MTHKLKTGAQGVSLVVAELLERNMSPYLPVVDDHGVDILLLSGIRIQVKTAHLSKVHKQMVYQFSCQRNICGRGGRMRGISAERRVFADECDLVVLVGLDEKRFWVIPANAIDAQRSTALVLGPKTLPTASDVQSLVAQGKNLDQIAEELGCCSTTVWQRKTKGDAPKGKIIGNIRSFENRWDLLTPKIALTQTAYLPMIYERDEGFVATLAGPIAA